MSLRVFGVADDSLRPFEGAPARSARRHSSGVCPRAGVELAASPAVVEDAGAGRAAPSATRRDRTRRDRRAPGVGHAEERAPGADRRAVAHAAGAVGGERRTGRPAARGACPARIRGRAGTLAPRSEAPSRAWRLVVALRAAHAVRRAGRRPCRALRRRPSRARRASAPVSEAPARCSRWSTARASRPAPRCPSPPSCTRK